MVKRQAWLTSHLITAKHYRLEGLRGPQAMKLFWGSPPVFEPPSGHFTGKKSQSTPNEWIPGRVVLSCLVQCCSGHRRRFTEQFLCLPTESRPLTSSRMKRPAHILQSKIEQCKPWDLSLTHNESVK